MANLPVPGTSLQEYQLYIRQELTSRGFANETISQKFMLFLEEAGEFAKAARKGAGIKTADNTVRTNLLEEAGDVLILFLDICNKLELDAETALLDKEGKNKQRSWQ